MPFFKITNKKSKFRRFIESIIKKLLFLNYFNNQLFINELKKVESQNSYYFEKNKNKNFYKFHLVLKFFEINKNCNFHDIEKLVNKINLNFYSSIALYRLSIFCGKFSAAYFFRKKAIFFLNKKSLFLYFRYFLNLSVEMTDKHIYKKIYDKKILRNLFYDEILEKSYLFKNSIKMNKIFPYKKNNYNNLMHKLIKKKILP